MSPSDKLYTPLHLRLWTAIIKKPTRNEVVVDLVLGVAMPIALLVTDRTFFTVDLLSLFGIPFVQMNVLAYGLIGLNMLVLIITLLSGNERFSGFFAGVMLAGGLFALSLGIVIFPYAVLGLLFLIGILGFLPFFTAVTYLRNSLRELSKAIEHSSRSMTVFMVAVGFTLAVSLPALAQWQADRYVTESILMIITDNPLIRSNEGVERLQRAFWCSKECYRPIAAAWSIADPEHQERLADIYFELTGEDVEMESLFIRPYR